MQFDRRFTVTRRTCRLAGTIVLAGGLALAATASAATGTAAPGVMQGFPPPADRLVDKANAFTLTRLRWALSNTRPRRCRCPGSRRPVSMRCP